MFTLTVQGNIPIKKNTQRISRHGGIYKPKDVVEYGSLVGTEAIVQRAKPVHGRFSISGSFRLKAVKDLDGALTTILDCLQENGLIDNDKMLGRIQDLEKIEVSNKDVESLTITISELVQ